jgi:hypothetical protein
VYMRTYICKYIRMYIHTQTYLTATTHATHEQPPPPGKPAGGLISSSVFCEGETSDPLARAVAEEAEKERRGYATVSQPLPPPKPAAPPPSAPK